MIDLVALWSEANLRSLSPLIARSHEGREDEPEALHLALFHGPRSGGLGLVRDLHDLWLLVLEVQLAEESLIQAARALRDRELEDVLGRAVGRTRRQAGWLRTRLDQAVPQGLTIPI